MRPKYQLQPHVKLRQTGYDRPAFSLEDAVRDYIRFR